MQQRFPTKGFQGTGPPHHSAPKPIKPAQVKISYSPALKTFSEIWLCIKHPDMPLPFRLQNLPGLLILCSIMAGSLPARGQWSCAVDSVAVLGLAQGEVTFYAAGASPEYSRVKAVSVSVEPAWQEDAPERREKPEAIVDYDNSWQDTAGWAASHRRLLPVSQVRATQGTELQEQAGQYVWEAKAAIRDKDDPPVKYCLSTFNRFFFLLRELSYTDNRGHGFGSYFSEGKKDNRKRWRITRTHLYSYYLADLGGGRRIIILTNERGQQRGYIIPVAQGFLVSTEEEHFEKAIAKKRTARHELPVTASAGAEDYYHIQTRTDRKQQLKDIWGNLVLPGAYDSIFVNGCFIAGEHHLPDGAVRYEVYNEALKPLPIKEKLRRYHPRYYYLQILSGNQVSYLDQQGRQILKPKIRIFSNVCGTVTSYSYEIHEDTEDSMTSYALTATTGGMGEAQERERTLVLEGVPPGAKLTFINRQHKTAYDDNDLLLGTLKIPPLWLLVQQNNRWGLAAFHHDKADIRSYESPRDSITLEKADSYSPARKQYRYADRTDSLTLLLPAVYDSIVTAKYIYNEPLRIYRNSLVGYFPLVKEARYSKLEECQANFIRFTLPGGRKGWLDLEDGKEYLDE